MSIQLLRCELEYYRPGEEIKGARNVTLYTRPIKVGAGTGIWVAKTPTPNDSIFVERDRITFVEECAFLRLKAIGLENDGVNSGDLDFRLSIEPVIKILGNMLFELVHAGEEVCMLNEKGRQITFIAVVDLTKNGCTFLGVLDLDLETLSKAMIKTKWEGSYAKKLDRK
jgi:hypothetical protein